MFRTVAIRALLAAALVVTIFSATTAQDEGPPPQGMEWHLVAYDAGGPELTDVPWGVDATLTLGEQAFGSAGCNGFDATYELDGEALTFGQPGTTDVGCPDRWLDVEAAYIAALPKVARWDIGTGAGSGRGLLLFDADDEHLLEFSSSATALLSRQVLELTDKLEAQQKVIKALRARIKALEPAG